MSPAVLYYAIPGFVLLLSIEAWFSYKENRHLYEKKDTFASLGLGIGNVIVGFVTKAMIFGLFSFLTYFVCLSSMPVPGGFGYFYSLQMIFPTTSFIGLHIIPDGSGLPMSFTTLPSIITWQQLYVKPGLVT